VQKKEEFNSEKLTAEMEGGRGGGRYLFAKKRSSPHRLEGDDETSEINKITFSVNWKEKGRSSGKNWNAGERIKGGNPRAHQQIRTLDRNREKKRREL